MFHPQVPPSPHLALNAIHHNGLLPTEVHHRPGRDAPSLVQEWHTVAQAFILTLLAAYLQISDCLQVSAYFILHGQFILLQFCDLLMREIKNFKEPSITGEVQSMIM